MATNKYTTGFFVERLRNADTNNPLRNLTDQQFLALCDLTNRNLNGAGVLFIADGTSRYYRAKGRTPRARVLDALRAIRRKTAKYGRRGRN